jgi:hypothetical protein
MKRFRLLSKESILLWMLLGCSFNLFAQAVVSTGSATGSTAMTARWRGLNNVNGGSTAFYLGNSNVGAGGINRVERTGAIYFRPGNNAVSFIYEPANDRLIGVINNDTLRYNNFSTRILSPSNICRLNFMNIILRNNAGSGAGILFQNVTLDGEAIGPFQLATGGSTVTWNVQNKDFSTGFVLRGTLTLFTGTYSGSESSKLEITVGETNAVRSTTLDATCAGQSTPVRFTGLLPNKTYTAQYTLNGVSATSASFNTNANGEGQFTLGPVSSSDFNTAFIVNSLAVSGGCSWTPTQNNTATLLEGSNCAILPLTWGLIQLQARGDQLVLDWQTRQEQNTASFEVERSPNGQSWQVMAKLPAAGNSQTIRNYQWVDIQPLPGLSFYRIRQIDLDRSFSLSKVLRFQWAQPEKIQVGPNPIRQTLTITVPANRTLTQLDLLDGYGQRIQQWKNLQGVLQIQTANLRAGKYLLRYQYKDGTSHTEPLLKLQ